MKNGSYRIVNIPICTGCDWLSLDFSELR